ncbi:MAG TPA: RNA polymerase sigma factor [Phycisphaerae bacterium]
MNPSDDELFRRAAAGESDSVAKLLLVYGPQVRARLTINPRWRAALDVEDVMQVTYLEAFLRISQIKKLDAATLVAWLTRVAQNNLRDAVKELERDKRPNPRRRIVTDDSVMALAELVGTTSSTGSRHVARKEAQRALEVAIDKLPAIYQKVVRLCDLSGKSPQEVAATLGRSVGAVKMIRSRAHDRLRELLGSPSRLFSTR